MGIYGMNAITLQVTVESQGLKGVQKSIKQVELNAIELSGAF